jgi:hypothetical protein
MDCAAGLTGDQLTTTFNEGVEPINFGELNHDLRQGKQTDNLN